MTQDCFKIYINLRKLIRDSKPIFVWKYLAQFRRYLTDWQNSIAHSHFQPSILPGASPWKRMPSGHRAQLWAACPVPHVLSSSLILLIVNVCRCNMLYTIQIMWNAYWSHEPTYSTRATWAFHHPFTPYGARIPHRLASHLPQPALPVLFQKKNQMPAEWRWDFIVWVLGTFPRHGVQWWWMEMLVRGISDHFLLRSLTARGDGFYFYYCCWFFQESRMLHIVCT